MESASCARIIVAFAVAVAGSACSIAIGRFDECAGDGDCSSGLGCVDRLCVIRPVPVLDTRCDIVGSRADQTFEFGALLPITDPDGAPGQWGPFWSQSIALAVDQLNDRVGVEGIPLRATVCDTAGDRDRTIELATYLAADRRVSAIVSDGSRETIAASSITIPAGVLLVAGAATAPEIADLADAAADADVGLVWRTAPSDRVPTGRRCRGRARRRGG